MQGMLQYMVQSVRILHKQPCGLFVNSKRISFFLQTERDCRHLRFMNYLHIMAESAKAVVCYGQQLIGLLSYCIIINYFKGFVFYVMQDLQGLKHVFPCFVQRSVYKLALNLLSYVEISIRDFFQRLKNPQQVIHCKAYYRACIKYYGFHANKLLANFNLALASTIPGTFSARFVFPI